MEITFVNPGVDYMIQSIMHFHAEGEAEFWSEPLDVLTFDIVEDGMSEIVFYSIDSNNPDNIYGHAYKCDISITSDVVDVGGRLWRR